ncbi:T9SS type A sorting domain-containing protein [Aquimarina sp. U1-2]|uniref:glycosyl hydrolase family 18 protein n=1 Tax=Aquimarina sp. U1-2 TaxID=2823141 RepID=UPI001AECE7BF|nr:glycosyl hydrolase family 18 protein [Aquimarina sp. U1-2]MBP2833012.1 T9SS type A sorting domain-containing protein [Aquimarina sp. U1-2]
MKDPKFTLNECWCYWKSFSMVLLFLMFVGITNNSYAQVNTGGSANTSNHNKQIIGYITNWDAWKAASAGLPSAGALTQLNIDYSKYTILNYSFFGVAVDGSLHSGDLRNKNIYQPGTVQQPGDLLYGDVYSSWDFYILFGEIEPIQWISEAVKQRAEALGFEVAVGGNTWTHPEWGLSGSLPLPLPKEGSEAKGLLELAHDNGVKVMASLGGWSMCRHFPEMAADPVKRARFIEDCKKLINMGFDGIDLDWEYPGPFPGMNFTGTNADYANFEILVQEIRDAIGPDKLITAAMAADYKKLEGFNWSKLSNTMDYFNMMTYDFNGGWSNIAGHNAPIYPYDGAEAPDFNWQTLLSKMTAMGVPSYKINFGAPFYGRGVITDGAADLNAPTVKRNVTIQPDGPVSTAADYTNWPQDVYDGTPNYFFIKQKTGPGSGWVEQWDDQAKVPYMTKGNFFLSYDNEKSIAEKAKFINANNLAGTIIWTVFGDLEFSGPAQSFGTKLKRWSNVKSPLVNTLNEVFASGGVGNQSPMVSITSPNTGDIFTAGDAIEIAASASDPDGTIVRVQFYRGTTLLSEDNSVPYTYTWSNASAGNYDLIAKAFDDKGASATAKVNISVTGVGGNELPVVTIISPNQDATFTAGSSISISADASDSDGTVSRVAFYNGSTLLGEDASAPFTYNWENVSEGSYTITATAFDNEEGEGSSSISITVNGGGSGNCTAPAYVEGQVYNGGDIVSYQGKEYKAKWWTQNNDPVTNRENVWELLGACSGGDSSAPQVSITSPTNTQSFAVGNTVTITANASDADGTINKVEFYVDGSKIGEDTAAPYAVNWTSTLGNHSIVAKATDNTNTATTSAVVTINVTSDGGGGCDGDSFKVVGYVPSWGNINNIQYDKLTHINYSFALPKSDGSLEPLSNPGKLQQIVRQGQQQGVKVLIAVGGWDIGDGGGVDRRFAQLAANPATRTAFVTNLVNFVNQYNLDGVDMDWEYPREGNEPQHFELLMEELGQAMRSRGKLLTAAVVVAGWNADGVLNGVFDDVDFLNIMAYDGPSHGSMAQATGGLDYWLGRGLPKEKTILGVPFYCRPQPESYANLLAMGASPNSDSFQGRNYNGIPTIKAKTELAQQRAGGIMIWELSHDTNDQSTSLLTAINQVAGNPCEPDNQAPQVTITAPAVDASFEVANTITITANASDSDGNISKVAFYVDGNLISEDTTSPYSTNWTAIVGNHTITARATDNKGAVSASSEVSISVIGDAVNQAPVVSIASPSNNASFTTGQNVAITANANDVDGSISKVVFYIDGTAISEDTSAPYSANWTSTVGSHSITTTATDNDSASTTSAAITITVQNQTGGCDAAQYVDGATYRDGDRVRNLGKEYECIVAGWCTVGGPYAPGDPNGWAWPNAWKEIGDCDGGGTGGNQSPTVSITQPGNGQSFATGSAITINASASDSDGTISKVEFFRNGTKIGEDTNSPYSFTWNNASQGNYTLVAKATDNENATEESTAVTITVGSTNPPNPGGDLPKRLLVGYWHNFDNGSSFPRLREVSDKWDVINVAFTIPTVPGGANMTFTPDPALYSNAQEFKNDVAFLQSRGKKVVISMGGATGAVDVDSPADAQIFSTSMINMIREYGFDGMDIDFEGSSIVLGAGDTDFRNPVGPKVVHLITAFKSILAQFDSDFVLSMAPETAFVQGGYSAYGSTFGAYLPVIHELRRDLDYIHVQHYNSGTMRGLDDKVYAQATADFHVAMAEMLLQGFPVNGIQFPALRQDQVMIGLPANGPAAPSGGFTPAAEVHKALDYLIKGQSFGGQYTLRNPSGYRNFRGLMTWSINWDIVAGFGFSNPHRAYLDGLDSRAAIVQDKATIAATVSPNPVNGDVINLNIESDVFNSTLDLQIFNATGIMVLEYRGTKIQKGNNLKTFDVSKLEEGLYFYTIATAKGKTTGKLIKR